MLAKMMLLLIDQGLPPFTSVKAIAPNGWHITPASIFYVILEDVVTMLDIYGFEVSDLGVDVPPAKFVEAVKQTGANIVGKAAF